MAEGMKPWVCPKCGGELLLDYPVKGRASGRILGVLPGGEMAMEMLDFDAHPSSDTSDTYCENKECDYRGTTRRRRYTMR